MHIPYSTFGGRTKFISVNVDLLIVIPSFLSYTKHSYTPFLTSLNLNLISKLLYLKGETHSKTQEEIGEQKYFLSSKSRAFTNLPTILKGEGIIEESYPFFSQV